MEPYNPNLLERIRDFVSDLWYRSLPSERLALAALAALTVFDLLSGAIFMALLSAAVFATVAWLTWEDGNDG